MLGHAKDHSTLIAIDKAVRLSQTNHFPLRYRTPQIWRC